MIALSVTVYDDDGEDRYKVMATTPEGGLADVTHLYEVAGTHVDGREGFVVLPKVEAPPPLGCFDGPAHLGDS